MAEQEQDRVTASGWRESVVDYIRAQALPVDKFGHQPRLYALAMQVGQGTDYDDDILFAAAWMHDLGVFIGHRPQDSAELASWNHVPYTIARTRELLAGWGFPAEKLEGVAEAIRTRVGNGRPALVAIAGRGYPRAVGRRWSHAGAGQSGPGYSLCNVFLGASGYMQGGKPFAG